MGNSLASRQEFNMSSSPAIILGLRWNTELADIDRTNNPFEVGLDWAVDLDQRMIYWKRCTRAIFKEPERKLVGRRSTVTH